MSGSDPVLLAQRRVDAWQLLSRLLFDLWSTMPLPAPQVPGTLVLNAVRYVACTTRDQELAAMCREWCDQVFARNSRENRAALDLVRRLSDARLAAACSELAKAKAEGGGSTTPAAAEQVAA